MNEGEGGVDIFIDDLWSLGDGSTDDRFCIYDI